MSQKINLIHRGPSVISQIDLFDECEYGADKLFLRGRFSSLDAIKEQVKIALNAGNLDVEKVRETLGEENLTEEEVKSRLGIGNPLTITPENGNLENVPTIALNRYHVQNKKFWNNEIPTDVKNPFKAAAAVTFAIRVFFREDSAFITFGLPWSEVMDEKEDSVVENWESIDAEEMIPAFRLFRNVSISENDALIILKQIFGEFGEGHIEIEDVLEISDEKGELISA